VADTGDVIAVDDLDAGDEPAPAIPIVGIP
jgi:hypothetical protein